jgi:hypothetical protein
VTKLQIFGAAEAADYLGISRMSFRARLYQDRKGISDGSLPEPMWVLACGPIWTKSQLDAWKQKQQ